MPKKVISLIYMYISMCVFTLCLSGCSIVNTALEYNNRNVQQRIICHAMGELEGNTYTNSLEAFELSYAKGFRYFEVDLGYTTDGRMVAVHDWEMWNNMCSIDLNGYFAPSFNDFKKTKILDKFTPLTLSDIADLLQQYDDIYIVTDTKRIDSESFENDLALIKGKLELKEKGLSNRLIIQVYNSDNLETARKFLSPENIIFTMYSSGLDEKGIISEINKNNDLFAVTIATWTITPEIAETAENSGVPVYVHTINNVNDINSYMDMGVYGFYTDIITPEEFRTLLSE